jgi:hypothetical protein
MVGARPRHHRAVYDRHRAAAARRLSQMTEALDAIGAWPCN